MKKIILGCFCLITSLLLTGCAQPSYHSVPVFHKPKTLSGKQCVKRCLQQKSRCDRRCGTDHEQCLLKEKKLAHARYFKYVKQMKLEDNKIKLTEADFIDYSNCSHSCRCVKSYKNCYTLCGGAVTKRKVCVKNCK